MATPHPSDLHILENVIGALNDLNGYGLTDAAMAALTNPATVDIMTTAINAIGTIHKSDEHHRTFGVAAINLAELGPSYRIAAPTIGALVLADVGGTLPDSTVYYYAVVAVDENGKLSYPSAEASQDTGTGGNPDEHTITVPWTEATGGFTYRVFRGTSAGVYTRSQDVSDAATVTDTGANFTTVVSTTLAALQAGLDAYYSFITDDMVDDARDAGTFASLRNAVADQHIMGTAYGRAIAVTGSVPYIQG